MLDPEHAGSISSRKLVVETAKHNVITAYASQELLETLEAFPHVSGVILNANMRDMPCAEMAQRIKQRHPAMPIIAVGPVYGPPCNGADHIIDNYSPQELLEILKTIEPAKSSAIFEHEKELSSKSESPE